MKNRQKKLIISPLTVVFAFKMAGDINPFVMILHRRFVSLEKLKSNMLVFKTFLACLKILNFDSTGGNSGQKSQVAFHQMPCSLGSASLLCRGIELPSSSRGG